MDRALRLHLDAAKALLAIRERRLYRAGYESFEDYCLARWQFSRAHANRHCDWAVVAQNVSPIGDVPLLESHARPLARLTADQQRTAWQEIRSMQNPTQRAIEQVCERVRISPVNGDCHETTEAEPVEAAGGLPWFGGKAALAPQIVRLLPPHTTYCEPFFGGGAVLFRKPPSRVEIVNDLNDDVWNFFRTLRGHGEELQRRLRLTPYSRTEHAKDKADPNSADPIEQARRFFVRVMQSYGCVENNTWRRSLGHRNLAADWASVVDRLHEMAERLRRVQIECQDALNLLPGCDRDGTVVYADPTYMGQHRTRNGKGYIDTMTEEDHERLLAIFGRYRRARVVLSGYASPLYDGCLQKWLRYEFSRRVKVCAAREGQPKALRTEVVWVSPAL